TDLSLPHSTGFNSIRTNLGSLENKGIEVELSVQILPRKSEFQWHVSFNASKVANRIIKLPETNVENNRVGGFYLWDASMDDYSWIGALQEGGNIGDVYAFKQLGIYSTDIEAENGPVDMIVTTQDKTKYGGHVNWLHFDRND